MPRTAASSVILIIIVGAIFYLVWSFFSRGIFSPTPADVSEPGVQVETPPIPISGAPAEEPEAQQEEKVDIEVVAENLDIPWEIEFLPTGEMLVTERPGQLLKIGADRQPIQINGVAHVGEGGLLGLTLHPDFSQNNILYLYLTTNTGGGLTNRVERYTLSGNELQNRQVVIENIPGAQFHDGGRIAFGPDSKLYITTGDAGVEPNAQDRNSLAGKILRLNDDGSIPSDNPFNTAVWSYGHRNPQGLAWDENGNLWATEHGRSGVQSGFDEINLIERGKNYGWPEIQGDETATGMEPPKAHSGSRETWAPSGMEIIGNTLFFTGLRGQSLYQTTINGTALEAISANLARQFGRIRTVKEGPDGYLYILTNNTDGRGNPATTDDRIIKLAPELFGL